MSTSKSQAEIDFENASDEDIINPKGATRPRAGQEELPIGTLVEAVLRGEQELGARPYEPSGQASWSDGGLPNTQALGGGVRAQDQHQPGGTVLAGTARTRDRARSLRLGAH